MKCTARTLMLALTLALTGLLPAARAEQRPPSSRRTFLRPRVDPRRQPFRRTRLTEFQPVTGFQPPLGASLPRRNTYYRINGRAAEIDRRGADNALGAGTQDPLRFYNNPILVERRSGFFRRR